MKSAEIRQAFLDFFKERGHEIVASSPLVPGNDPTLLFTNAGMVQFKDVFLGDESRSYDKAVSSQRCVRAGGKHNDLENVGYTARHHTFFEMLGNFSFGDYFKREAIQYGWDFLTKDLQLPADKLWVTVYEDDDEAADIWLKEIGVDPSCFTRIGDKPGKKYESDNFWAMGDTGPCGPCSEIFYDHGPHIPGGPPGSPDEDGDRYIEIWNLVFMQFNRSADGTMEPLPKPSVDTGMGLERLAAIQQKVHSNYEIDLFQSLIKATAALTGTQDLEHSSLRVIADHIRACAFLVVDGVVPSNEGRGYVLRRIIRRAIRHGYKLEMHDSFFYKLVGPLCDEMGEAYPELIKARPQVERALRQEEERFAETLDQGMKILEQEIAEMDGKTIAGDTVFKLYDTFGFPLDLTADIARERGLQIDLDGYEAAMENQREQARAASKFGIDYTDKFEIEGKTEFSGYENLASESVVNTILVEGSSRKTLSAGEQAVIVLDQTPFYAESGGQVGDTGFLRSDAALFRVVDTQKQGDVFVHLGSLESGNLNAGDSVNVEVDAESRQAIVLNHSATHLMHAALREVLGDHVAQKGSLVDAEKLRFDFSHFEPMSAEQIESIESIVNDQIRLNAEVVTRISSYDDAVASGAMALFGEKYGDEVRMLSIGDFSIELCGGTHVARAGDIGLFKITSEGGVAAGVRRIEAITGKGALNWIRNEERVIRNLSDLVKGSRENIEEKVQQLLDRTKNLEKELDQIKGKLASTQGSDLVQQAVEVDGIKVLAAKLENADVKTLRDTVDQLKNKLDHAAVLLAAVDGEKISLVAGVTKDCTNRIQAGDLMRHAASQIGGKGGGRPDLAQGGGTDLKALDGMLKGVPEWVTGQLG